MKKNLSLPAHSYLKRLTGFWELYLVKTKGARPRDIPIRTTEQRELIDEVKKWVKGKLIGFSVLREMLDVFEDSKTVKPRCW